MKNNDTEDALSKFLKIVKNEKIYPPIGNSNFFIRLSGYNSRRYFEPYYKNKSHIIEFVLLNKEEGYGYLSRTKLDKISEEVFCEYWENPNSLKSRKKEFFKLSMKINRFYNLLSNDYIAKNSIEKLIPLCQKIIDLEWSANSLLLFTISLEKEWVIKFLNKKSKLLKDEIDNVWKNASNPISESFDRRKEIILLNMIKDKKKVDDIIELIQYASTGYYGITSVKKIKEQFKKDYGKISPLKAKELIEKYNKEKLKKQTEYNRWIKGLSNEEKKLVDYIQFIIKFRDLRKEFMIKAMTCAFRLGEKIIIEAGLDLKYLRCLTFNEAMMGVDYVKKIKEEILARENGSMGFVDYEGKVTINLTNFNETKKIIDYYYTNQNYDNKVGNIINGQIGCPGKIIGKVVLITDLNKHAFKMKRGCILVTGMTRPEFISLMKKASAIITDEGGITCHAAIISRELKIPCIIGTKIATHVLKDGMLVEVNASKGIVKIIKSK